MPEFIVVLAIDPFIFGPSRLPSIGKGIKEATRELKKRLKEEPAKGNDKIEKEICLSTK